MDKLNLGTKEIYSIQIKDVLNVISDLDGINVEQKIVSEDETVKKQDWTTVVQTSGMRVDCLINTTAWTAEDEGTWKLYLRVNIAPELPILGPFEFNVS